MIKDYQQNHTQFFSAGAMQCLSARFTACMTTEVKQWKAACMTTEVKQWKACEQNKNSNRRKKETRDSHNNWHCSMHDKSFDSSFTVILKICSKVIIELEIWRSRNMLFCIRHFLTLNYSCGYAVYILVKTWELQMFYFRWAFRCFATFKISLLILHVCVVV